MHVLSREGTVCNVKAWRISPCACLEKYFHVIRLHRLLHRDFVRSLMPKNVNRSNPVFWYASVVTNNIDLLLKFPLRSLFMF